MESLALHAGEKLRILLKEHDLTQEEFAFERYIDIRTVNRWINKGIKNLETIEELAEYFHVAPVEFFA